MKRRDLLGLAVTAGIGGSLPQSFAGAVAKPLGIDASEAWMLLAGALDDRLVIWWLKGFRYGVVDGRSTLLYGMEAGIFQRYFERPDGNWDIAMFELTYYTDLDTGELLDEYANPFTGVVNKARQVRLGPEVRLQTSAGQQADPEDQVIQSMLHDYATTLGPVTTNGNSIWIPTSVEGRIAFPGGKVPDIILNHYTTAMGSAADAANPALRSAPCSLAFQNVLRWEPWMQMTGHAGHLMSRAHGRKFERLEELPANYLEMARRVHPKLINDPLQTLAGPVAKIQARRAAAGT